MRGTICSGRNETLAELYNCSCWFHFWNSRFTFFLMFWLLSKCVYRLWQKTKQIGSEVNKRTLFIQLLFSFQETHTHTHTQTHTDTLKSTVKLLFSSVLERWKHCKHCECCSSGFCQDCPTVRNYFYWLPFNRCWRMQQGDSHSRVHFITKRMSWADICRQTGNSPPLLFVVYCVWWCRKSGAGARVEIKGSRI